MSLKFIDDPSSDDDDDATLPTVRSDSERRFRTNYKEATGSLKGVDNSYRRSLANQTTRDIFGLDQPGRGPVTQRVAAPTAAEIDESLRAEATPVNGRRFGRPGIDIPTQYDDDQQYQNQAVSIGLSII